EQADIRADRSDVGEELEVVLQAVELARGRGAHRALSAFQLHARIHATPLADAVELAEAAFEDRFEPGDVAVALGGARIEFRQLRAGPEPLLEAHGLALGAVEHALLAEDDH